MSRVAEEKEAEQQQQQVPTALIPRFTGQDYAKESIDQRRRWVEQHTEAPLDLVGTYSLDGASMRGNIENAIGTVQVPLGVAGPLLINGEHAQGTFYVPLATTEGALVRSYERGMLAMTRAGGVAARIASEGNRASPLLVFENVEQSHEFVSALPRHIDTIKAVAESTTSHGKLLGVHARPIGRDAIVDLQFHTADAHGMNMIAKATQAVCQWLAGQFAIQDYYVLSGGSCEKRAGASLFRGGKGKYVTAGLLLPAAVVQRYLGTTPTQLYRMWHKTLMAQLQAGAVGYNGHYANGLAALFIACGQDVANITNCSVGITSFEVTGGDLYASVTLPSLTVGTVGGGTALGTSRECLQMLGCAGGDRSRKFAEIVAATLLAGELSFGAALGSGEFVDAHETYGRNRPRPTSAPSTE